VPSRALLNNFNLCLIALLEMEHVQATRPQSKPISYPGSQNSTSTTSKNPDNVEAICSFFFTWTVVFFFSLHCFPGSSQRFSAEQYIGLATQDAAGKTANPYKYGMEPQINPDFPYVRDQITQKLKYVGSVKD